jgi:hypothetical protein
LQEHPKSGKKKRKGKGKHKKIAKVALENNPKKQCKHCNADGHKHESCWKLHPELRPNWSKQQQQQKKIVLVVEGDQRVENNLEIESKVTCTSIQR